MAHVSRSTSSRSLGLLMFVLCLCILIRPRWQNERQAIDHVQNLNLELRNVSSRAPIPPYNRDNWFTFVNFPPNEANGVVQAMIGIIPMLITTVQAINADPDHPSFKRYFNAEDLPVVSKLFENLLGVLGMADYETLRSCLRTRKLEFLYGDGPGATICSTTSEIAYSWEYTGADGYEHHYIALCAPFFQVYQTYLEVPCRSIGPSSDPGDRGKGTIWSASLTILHELMHWSELTIEVAQLEIDDLVMTRQDTGQVTKAYEPFYSMHVKDWGAAQGLKPTRNVDNYVFMVAEIFYAAICVRNPAWIDPPPTDKIWSPSFVGIG